MVSSRGLRLALRVTPRGGRDAIEGFTALADGRSVLMVRVRAAPEDGHATRMARRLIAAAAGVPPSRVTLIEGAKSRIKIVEIDGDPESLARALASIPGPVRSQDPT